MIKKKKKTLQVSGGQPRKEVMPSQSAVCEIVQSQSTQKSSVRKSTPRSKSTPKRIKLETYEDDYLKANEMITPSSSQQQMPNLLKSIDFFEKSPGKRRIMRSPDDARV